MGDHRLPNSRVVSGELEKESWRRRDNVGRGEGEEWTDCVTEDRRVFGITEDWSTAAFDHGALYKIVHEHGCRTMAAWARGEGKASENRQRKRKVEEANKVKIALGVTVGSLSLSLFRAALIRPTQMHRMCSRLSLYTKPSLASGPLCVARTRVCTMHSFYLWVSFASLRSTYNFWYLLFCFVFPLFLSFLSLLSFYDLIEAIVDVSLISSCPANRIQGW